METNREELLRTGAYVSLAKLTEQLELGEDVGLLARMPQDPEKPVIFVVDENYSGSVSELIAHTAISPR